MSKVVKSIKYLNQEYKFYVEPDTKDLIKSFLNRGILWEYGLVKMYLNFLTPKDQVIDIGAYIGTHTIPLAKRVNWVFTFEPVRKFVKELLANIKLNDLKNVTYYQIALGSKTACGKMHTYNQSNEGNTYITPNGNEDVNIRRLDDYINHFTNVRLIKIDVEKYEYEVLKGAIQIIKKFKPIIISEVDGGNPNQPKLYQEHELLDFLKNLGYNVKYFADNHIIAVHQSDKKQ